MTLKHGRAARRWPAWIVALAVVTAGLAVAPVTAQSADGRIELAPADGRKGYPQTARADGFTYIAWADAGRGIALRRIDDDGNVTQPSGIETTGIYYQPQVSASGSHVYVTWSQNFTLNNNQPFEAMLAWSADYGQSFQTIRLTTSPSFAQQVDVLSPMIASSGDVVAVTWRQGGSGHLWIAEHGQEAFAQNVALAGLEPSDVAIGGGKVHAISIDSSTRARRLTSVEIVGGAVTTTTVTATPAGSPAKLAAQGPNVYAAWVDAKPLPSGGWDDLVVLSASSDSGASFAGSVIATHRCQVVNPCVTFDLEEWDGLPFLAWEHSGRVLESHGFVPGLGGLTAPVLVAEQDPFAGGAVDLVVSDDGVFVTYLTTIPDATDPSIDNWEVMVAARRHGSGEYSDVRNLSRTTGGSFLPALAERGRGYGVAWTEWLGSAYSGPCCSVLYQPSVLATDDLELVEADVVQATYGAERLAAGKPTVVRVQFRNGFTTAKTVRIGLVLENAGNSIVEAKDLLLKPDATQVFLRPDDPFRPEPGDLSVSVTLDGNNQISETDETNNTGRAEYKVKDTRGLRVRFVPIDTPGDSVKPPSCGQMEAFAITNGLYLDATFPVDPDETRYKETCTPLKVPVTSRLSVEELDALTFDKLHAMNSANEWDVVVGVYRKRWLDDHTVDFSIPLPSDGYAGLAGFASAEKAVLASIDGSGGWEVAHEISHQLGWVEAGHALEDPTTESGHLVFQASPGYWVELKSELHDKADWMFNSTQGASLADARGRWLSPATYDFLLSSFAHDPIDPPLISLRARVYPDDTVDVPAWYEDDGFLDVELEAEGEYALRYLDGAGSLLGETAIDGSDSFSGGTESGHATSAAGFVNLAAKIPSVAGAETIQLWRGATLLYERVRSDNAPTVSVTSPEAGATIRTGNDMTIAWDASDVDGDTLSHIVSISTDGGSTWLPLAPDLAGTSVSLPIRRDLVATGALIKVTTSDGWRTSEAVSDPFDIIVGSDDGGRIAFSMGTFYCAVPLNQYGFCADRRWNHDIYEIGPGGTDKARLLETTATAEVDPAWSPDGSKIAYTTDGYRLDLTGVGVMDADGTDRQTLVPGGYRPDWSPDGSMLVFEPGPRVVVVATGEVIETGWGHNGTVGFPDWSPDGTRIAYNLDLGIRITDARAFTTPFGVEYAEPSTRFWENCAQPAWSPDGSQLACVWERNLPNFGGAYDEIAVITVDGSEPIRDVSRFYEVDGERRMLANPEWSPDGSEIAYVDMTGGPGSAHVEVVPSTFNASDRDRTIPGAGPNMDWPNEFGFNENPNSHPSGLSWKGGVIAPEPAEPEPLPSPDAGGPYQLTEGGSIELDATSSSGEGELTYGWDLDGDGQFDDATGATPQASWPDDGEFAVALLVVDENGSVATDLATVSMRNAAPELTDVTATMVPGALAELHARVSDAGAADVLSADVDWGDGTTDEATLARDGDGYAVYGTHEYATTGEFDVTVTAADDDGDSDVEIVALDVAPANVAPTATVISTSTAQDTAVEVVLDGSDPDGGPGALAYEIVDAPANGTLGGLPFAGAPGEPVRVTYFPALGLSGADSFTYRVHDGLEVSAPATVTVDVVAARAPDPDPGVGPDPTPTPTVTPSTPVPTPTPDPTTDPDPTPEPERCTITGSADDDRLEGTAGDDVICAGGGDDTILGRGGDDVVLAGRGQDRVRGGGGSDEIFGRRGADVLRGGAGPDVILGGGARDVLLGGRGRDHLQGGPHRDALDGGPGSDLCAPEPTTVLKRCESAPSDERESALHEERWSRPARWGVEHEVD